jgi:hypothetical protein
MSVFAMQRHAIKYPQIAGEISLLRSSASFFGEEKAQACENA